MEGFLHLIYYTRPCESESPDSGARAGVSPTRRPSHAGTNAEIQAGTRVEVKAPHVPLGARVEERRSPQP